MKRIISLILSISMVFSTTALAAAESLDFNKIDKIVEKITYTVPKEELEANFQAQLDKIIREAQGSTRDYGDTYETEIIYTRYATIDGYLYGNLPGGTKFPTGGGFIYSKTGGTSLSVSLQLPAPFNIVYVGGTLGRAGVSGYYISAPNNYSYFKLWGEKTYKIKAYKIYEIDAVTGIRSLYKTGVIQEPYSDAYWCKAQ